MAKALCRLFTDLIIADQHRGIFFFRPGKTSGSADVYNQLCVAACDFLFHS
jgi:hypothetical protein